MEQPTEDPTQQPKLEPQQISPQPKSNAWLVYLAIAVVVAAVAGIAVIHAHNSKKAPAATNTTGAGATGSKATGAKAGGTARLYLSPAASAVAGGSQFTVQVRADSGTTTVNAVEANFSYPADKLTFVSISDSGTAYGVKAAATGANGTITIARGNTSPLTGDQPVASVTFSVKSDSTGTAGLAFLSSSAVVSSTTNTNVLGSTAGGTYQIR